MARALLPNQRNLTDFGDARARLVFVMIGLLDGDQEQVERAWQAMSRADESSPYLQKALIWAGETEEARALLRRNLEDVDRRYVALAYAQQYTYDERGLTPVQLELLRLERNFYDSEEVRSLIQEYGRVSAYGIRMSDVYP